MMTEDEKRLIEKFFDSTGALLQAKIIRSANIMGDIGEWLCVKHYGLKLETSGRHKHFDGYIDGKRVQVKLHNAPIGTNHDVGNPLEYDVLFVIIGPHSRLRKKDGTTAFHVYKFEAAEVRALMKRKKGYFCGMRVLHPRQHDSITYE